MQFRYAAILVISFIFIQGSTNAALAGNDKGPGTEVVRKANEQISVLLRNKVEPGSKAEAELAAQVTTSVRDFLDIEALGRRALKDHWDGLSPAQRDQFMTLLRQLIEKNYIKGLRANLDYQVTYTGERKKADDIVVSTEVKTKRRGRPYTIAIDYVLRKDGNKLRAFDVITDSVGLVENYRAQFNKIIAKHGFDGLLARMKKKADKLDQ
jgi:phospholipid transport system substrate-binding protein